MSPMARTLLAGTLLALLTTPILAQRELGQPELGQRELGQREQQSQRNGADRPSRQCVREIVKLCGPDRAQIPACLSEKGTDLSTPCQAELRERMKQRQQAKQPAAQPFVPAMRPARSVLFGDHQRQRIDIYEPDGAVENLPMVLFVHGGAWRMGNHTNVQVKPRHFGDQDIYFASTGYRLLPETPVEDQARDVGLAVQALVGQARVIGFDPERLVIMGHSAGAHLAALVATDPQYAGEAFDAIRGVILLDGAGYDIAQNIEDAEYQSRLVYEDAFGYDGLRHRALSPLTHVGGPDAPHWLALYVEQRTIAKKQSELLVGKLIENGQSATAMAIADTDHGRMNREIGTAPGAAQTRAIDAFLAAIFD